VLWLFLLRSGCSPIAIMPPSSCSEEARLTLAYAKVLKTGLVRNTTAQRGLDWRPLRFRRPAFGAGRELYCHRVTVHEMASCLVPAYERLESPSHPQRLGRCCNRQGEEAPPLPNSSPPGMES
jgi:hypothetical protein